MRGKFWLIKLKVSNTNKIYKLLTINCHCTQCHSPCTLEWYCSVGLCTLNHCHTKSPKQNAVFQNLCHKERLQSIWRKDLLQMVPVFVSSTLTCFKHMKKFMIFIISGAICHKHVRKDFDSRSRWRSQHPITFSHWYRVNLNYQVSLERKGKMLCHDHWAELIPTCNC